MKHSLLKTWPNYKGSFFCSLELFLLLVKYHF